MKSGSGGNGIRTLPPRADANRLQVIAEQIVVEHLMGYGPLSGQFRCLIPMSLRVRVVRLKSTARWASKIPKYNARDDPNGAEARLHEWGVSFPALVAHRARNIVPASNSRPRSPNTEVIISARKPIEEIHDQFWNISAYRCIFDN